MDIAAVLSILRQALIYYVGFNLFLLFGFAINRFASYLIRDWPSVTGTVTSSSVSHHVSLRSHGSSSSSPLVVYTYDVNGETYTSQNIAPGLNITGTAADLVRRFPVGAQVTVYYSPTSPSISYLSRKSLIEPYLLTYFILGNLLMPFIVLFVNLMKSTFFNF